MSKKYFPEILTDKIILFFKYIYAIFLLLVAIFFLISFLTFDINDNSLLTITNNPTNNFFGDVGSYTASFFFYTFGV